MELMEKMRRGALEKGRRRKKKEKQKTKTELKKPVTSNQKPVARILKIKQKIWIRKNRQINR